MLFLRPEPLSASAFAPFGDVIELAGARQIPINAGTTIRFHDLAEVDVLAEGGRTLINLFGAQPRDKPVVLSLMERHPLGSQAFLPIADRRSPRHLTLWWWRKTKAAGPASCALSSRMDGRA